MSISAVLHSRPPLNRFPGTMEDAKTDFQTFFDEKNLETFRKYGKSGARIFGVALLTAMLTAYAPETFAAHQHMPVSSTTIFLQAMEFGQKVLPDGVRFANEAANGALEFAGALAVQIQDNIVAPSVGAVRASGSGLLNWVSEQRVTAMSLGANIAESVKEVADYLIPKTKGEIVERGILVLAALKSFTEGVELAMKGLKRLGRKMMGKRPESDVPTPIEVHHHHYYGDTDPRPDTMRPPRIDAGPHPVTKDAANDNDWGSPQA